jgi:hypothetical protein
MTTIASTNGAVLEAACSAGSQLEARIRGTEDDGALGIGVTYGTGQTDAELDRSFDTGETVALDLGHGDAANVDFNFVSRNSPVLAAQVSLADDGGLAGDHACALWGVYESP